MSSLEQMAENKVGEATFQQFAAELKAAGFDVHPEHDIDPVTGRVTYVSVRLSNPSVFYTTKALGVFTRLNAANVLIGIGSDIRNHLWSGVSNGTIKLNDFGFRRTR